MHYRATLLRGVAVVGALAAAAACYHQPDAADRANEDVIVTAYDTSATFSSYTTFAIRPDVPIIRSADTTTELLDAATASALIEAVARNMTARGYTRSDQPASADLGVEIGVISFLNAEQVCYPYSYWSTYWTPYYWGYSGYPYYAPWGCSTTTWRSGTVVFDVLDLRLPGARPVSQASAPPPPDMGTTTTPSLKAIWFGSTYGVLTDTSAENVTKAVLGIDQAFLQSPYFTK